nr:tyrosine-type recombinase/integrase [Harryflintia acetispora]
MNLFFAAVDGFLKKAGARDLQIASRLKPSDEPQPELSRTEYLRLLQTAKRLGKEREYLLIKLFGTTGLPLQELSQVTVETVRDGEILVSSSKNKQVIHLPDFLCEELLSYTSRNAIETGAIFLTRDRKPMGRTNVTMAIRQICIAAHLPEEKGNPRCLKRLHQSTIAGIEANVALLVEHTYKRIIEKEQLSISWKT